MFGVILGGRLGYVLFYNLQFFLQNPLQIFAVWQGGMSFHGGLIGVIIATLLFVKKQRFSDVSVIRNSFRILDLLAVVAPIGLGLGRIANFINMEVMGRPHDDDNFYQCYQNFLIQFYQYLIYANHPQFYLINLQFLGRCEPMV